MKLKGQVVNANIENRELVGKDGTKRQSVISHILIFGKNENGTEVYNVRSYDANFPLPPIGKEWETPPVKKYECFDGQVAEVMV